MSDINAFGCEEEKKSDFDCKHCNEHHHDHSSCGCGHGHGCDCKHPHEDKTSTVLLAVSAVLVAISFIPMGEILKLSVLSAAVILSSYPILFGVLKKIKHFSLTETELMLIAIVAACFLGDYREAAVVGILYRVGEYLEDKSIAKSRESIDAVSQIQQDFAHLIDDDGTSQTVMANSVSAGSLIQVLPYERFPLDGIVLEGETTVDASAITGESLPITKTSGDEVKSGMMNGTQTVTVRTTEILENSTASRIIHMVEEASEKKDKTQRAVTKIAKIYTPVVVILALIIAVVPSVITKNPADWVYRALVFLVASCPCAIVISVPLAFYSGLGEAARNGILLKGSVFVDRFSKAKAMVFDKTGTLTDNSFEIENLFPLNGFTENQLLILAAAAEHYSSHPIAKSITAAAPQIDESLLSDFRETAGNGTSVLFAGKRVLCGSKRLLAENSIPAASLPTGYIYVCADNTVAGTIAVKNKVRKGTREMLKKLKSQGIRHTVMLTGDNQTSAAAVAEDIGIDEYFCDLLPEDKLSKLEEIKNKYGSTVYVGDGINDAPVLAASDVGVAMGLGTQAASEAADIILTNDRLDKLSQAHKLFKRTNAAVWFNIVFSISAKLIVLILGALGKAPVWLAVFADVGVALICVAVSILMTKDKKIKD